MTEDTSFFWLLAREGLQTQKLPMGSCYVGFFNMATCFLQASRRVPHTSILRQNLIWPKRIMRLTSYLLYNILWARSKTYIMPILKGGGLLQRHKFRRGETIKCYLGNLWDTKFSNHSIKSYSGLWIYMLKI